MAKITITEPEKYVFSAELDVYVGMINQANHLANEFLIALLNEARNRFYAAHAIDELTPQGCYFINADMAINYRAEAYHGDTLKFEIGIQDINRVGADFVYRVTRPSDNTLIAQAKTAMLMFDPTQKRVVDAPKALWDALNS